MKNILFLYTLIVTNFFAVVSFASNAQDDFTLYLVRHAEKEQTRPDPKLTYCGQQRAQQLATILRNVDIDSIYSTAYQRTLGTATPTAQSKSIAIKQYAPNGLEQLARELISQRKSSLVVGHSNTTPQLVSILTGQPVIKMTEQEYQHLFQIKFVSGKATLTKLSQPLACN